MPALGNNKVDIDVGENTELWIYNLRQMEMCRIKGNRGTLKKKKYRAVYLFRELCSSFMQLQQESCNKKVEKQSCQKVNSVEAVVDLCHVSYNGNTIVLQVHQL